MSNDSVVSTQRSLVSPKYRSPKTLHQKWEATIIDYWVGTDWQSRHTLSYRLLGLWAARRAATWVA